MASQERRSGGTETSGKTSTSSDLETSPWGLDNGGTSTRAGPAIGRYALVERRDLRVGQQSYERGVRDP